mmetsp:Transcript_64609/g.185848  ORF Transcript_64609/g.185848 Transcript_64609/m.185848 type:complete len:262 (-) Transcript_64609:811-1596(-)
MVCDSLAPHERKIVAREALEAHRLFSEKAAKQHLALPTGFDLEEPMVRGTRQARHFVHEVSLTPQTLRHIPGERDLRRIRPHMLLELKAHDLLATAGHGHEHVELELGLTVRLDPVIHLFRRRPRNASVDEDLAMPGFPRHLHVDGVVLAPQNHTAQGRPKTFLLHPILHGRVVHGEQKVLDGNARRHQNAMNQLLGQGLEAGAEAGADVREPDLRRVELPNHVHSRPSHWHSQVRWASFNPSSDVSFRSQDFLYHSDDLR